MFNRPGGWLAVVGIVGFLIFSFQLLSHPDAVTAEVGAGGKLVTQESKILATGQS